MTRGLISLDAAGTLIQVSKPVSQTYAEFARRHAIIVQESSLKAGFRSAWAQQQPPLHPEGQASPDDDRSWWQQLVQRVFTQALGFPLPTDLLVPLFTDLYQHYAQPEAWAVFDDVFPALHRLAPAFDLCVLSNFDRRLLTILDGHGLLRPFAAILMSSEVGAAKPHPRMFAAALQKMNARPESTLHIGDDPGNDLEGARAAGWHAAWIQRPQSTLITITEKVFSGAYSGLMPR
jgi:putative hydrolase of the HAD superfamily